MVPIKFQLKMSIQSAIVGKWNFESSENFDAYMKEVGLKKT